MMSNKHGGFVPAWHEQAPPEKSYRSIFKWGDPQEFKHPNPRLYELMKSTFQMSDEDFRQKQKMGLEEVSFDLPTSLTPEQIEHFKKIVGQANIREDEYSRLQVAYGKTMIDLMRLREGIVENVPDLVIHPRDKEDIQKIVDYCHQEKINIYVYAGGSSVTRGRVCQKGHYSRHARTYEQGVEV